MIARKEPDLAGRFRKNPDDEAFLRQLNDILAPHEEAQYRDLPESFPTIFVVGVPRSGTTLLSQLISAHLPIGYINNLIAAFWRAPVHGIRLSRKLLDGHRETTYRSDFGRTARIQEPHEFGYFWSMHLRYEEMIEKDPAHDDAIDWERLRKTIVNMTYAFEAPLAFKAVLAGWHIRRIQRSLPEALFVRVRRDPVENAKSIMRMRKEYLGSYDTWLSMKPREHAWLKGEPIWSQVAGQVYHLERTMTEQLQHAQALELGYEEICRDPRAAVERIGEKLGGLRPVSLPPASFPMTVTTSGSVDLDEKIAAAVRELNGD